AIAAAVRELLGSERTRRRYGSAGRERVQARFTWRRVADGVEQVYRRVTAGREIGSEVA
ncbi:glycosyltransferase family 4 protein, partial [Streptomyces sp. SID9944]|nr:glycosyltransferase family 4 protein [Streptomyces sp. SID9944]